MSVTRRPTALIAASALALLVAAALVISSIEMGQSRGRVQAALAERLRRDVAIGSMHVSFWPLGVRLEQVVIGEDPAFPTGRPFALADTLYVSVSPVALLRGRIDLRAVELRAPQIEMVRSGDGVWNVASLGAGRGSGTDDVVLTRLIVTSGQVAVTSLTTREPRRAVYQDVDVTLDDVAADKPFRVVLTARLPGPGEPRLTLRGEGGPIERGRLAQASFTGQVEFDAIVTGTANVVVTAREVVLDGITAELGSTRAQGRITARNFASPEIDFDLAADTIDVVELQRLLAPARQAPSQGDDHLLLRITGTGRLRAGAIRYNGILLEDAETDARIDRGVITLRPLTASFFGGKHRGMLVVDTRQAPAVFTVDSRLDQVDANRLLSATTNLDDVVNGALDASNQVTFTADGADRIAASLHGTLSVSIPDGRIAHMDLMHAIRRIAGFEGDDEDRQITAVRDLRARFTVVSGVAHTEDLAAIIDEDSTVAGTGSIDLVNRTLDLRLTAVLSRGFSDRLGGRRLAGLLSTVLANERGELVVPLLVTGTTEQPRVAPDLRRIAEMKLGGKLPEDPAARAREALRRILERRRTNEPPPEPPEQ